MTLQQLKEQEMVEFENYIEELREKYPVLGINQLKDWLSSHDLRLEQAIREDERSKLQSGLTRVR